jgi:hypothetical protein
MNRLSFDNFLKSFLRLRGKNRLARKQRWFFYAATLWAESQGQTYINGTISFDFDSFDPLTCVDLLTGYIAKRSGCRVNHIHVTALTPLEIPPP